MRPSLNKDARIATRCSKGCKDRLSRKLIAIGYSYQRSGDVEPLLSDFLEALSDKPLTWFEENFGKSVDGNK